MTSTDSGTLAVSLQFAGVCLSSPSERERQSNWRHSEMVLFSLDQANMSQRSYGPCGERVIIWPISAREPESVDVGWAVRCHAKPPVPRSLNMIPFTCPLSLVLFLPPPLHHRLDLLRLPSPPPPPPPSPPWDRLSST
ncbi:unnamed protein product [Pleuronectes platessa]|uniref:Uncharacterized protein n=1 Tax=Pleuronectes platessa TaxID=8262 RepID=A0A9N7W015_PLEPL|nr:unnamed protein product [Pleuronectes platessa]